MVFGTNLSIFLLTAIFEIVTLIELFVIFPFGVAGDVLVGVTVFTALHNNDNILIVLVAIHNFKLYIL